MKRLLARLLPALLLGVGSTANVAFAEEGVIEEIVVTGSYIKRDSFSSASPLTIVGQEDFNKIGAISVKDVVQNLTNNSGSENFADQGRSGGTVGTENINIRGLGINGTLVLLNGKRQAESPNLNNDGIAFVDTASMMPTIAIERMEILTDGASALYGSDAISGVVNFITRNEFEGFEFSVDYQAIPDSDENWNDVNYQAIFGVAGDRGNIVVAAQYLERDQLAAFEKGWTLGGGNSGSGQPGTFLAVPGDARTNGGAAESLADFAGRNLAFEQTSFFVDPGIVAAGGDLLAGSGLARAADFNCLNVPQADPANGTPVSFLFPTPALPTQAETCRIDFLQTQSLIEEQTRLKLFAAFSYDLIPEHDIEVYGEFHAAANDVRRSNSPSFPQSSPQVVPIQNPGLRQDAIDRGLAGPEVIDPAAALAAGFTRTLADGSIVGDPVAAAIANPNVGPLLFVGRALSGIPEETTRNRGRVDTEGVTERDKIHIATGIRGDLPNTETWSFDFSGTWSEHQFSGFAARDFALSIFRDSLAGFGGRNCDPLDPTNQPGVAPCFFFNPFGSQHLADPSDIGPNGLYNSDTVIEDLNHPLSGENEQSVGVVDFVITGDTFELPAGPLGIALGAQYRKQKYRSIPSGTGTSFDFIFVAGQEEFSVNRDVWGVFAEALIPVTGPDSPIGALEIDLAVRFEEYGGGTGNTTDPKISILWNPTEDFVIRGSAQTSFRAPGLAQLGGASTSLNAVPSDLGALAAGQPAGTTFVPNVASGNSDLAPEEADVFNVGFGWRPSSGALEGLSIDFNYWSFDFEDVIRKEGTFTVAQAFVDGDPAAQQKVTLNAAGEIALIRTNFINAAKLETEGYDARLSFDWETEGAGVITPFFNATRVTRYRFDEGNGEVNGLGQRNFQTIAAPALKWRFNTGLDWYMGNHSANITVRYWDNFETNAIDAVFAAIQGRIQPGDDPSDPDLRKIDSHTTVDVNYTYQLPDVLGASGITFSIGAINLTDEDPPVLNQGPGFESKIHDPRGRVVYGSFRFAF